MTLTRGGRATNILSQLNRMESFHGDSQNLPKELTDLSVDTMPIDIYAEGDHLIVKTSISGVKPGQVDVQVHGDTLTISAQLADNAKRGPANRRIIAKA